jgi:hypothetical protein
MDKESVWTVDRTASSLYEIRIQLFQLIELSISATGKRQSIISGCIGFPYPPFLFGTPDEKDESRFRNVFICRRG